MLKTASKFWLRGIAAYLLFDIYHYRKLQLSAATIIIETDKKDTH